MRSALVTLILLSAWPAWAGDAAPRSSPKSVTACDRQGAGFVALPGSNTCIRIGGSVSADFVIARPKLRPIPQGAAADWRGHTGMVTRGDVDFDARTPTELGTVRTFVRTRAQSRNGEAPSP